MRPAALPDGDSRPRDLLRNATGLRGPRREGQARPGAEFGRAECQVLDPDEPLFHGVPTQTTVWMSHGDQVQRRAGIRAAGRDGDLPDRGGQATDRAGLRAPVSSRGGPHALRLLDPRQFSRPDLSEPAELDDGGVHRASDRADRPSGGPADRVVCGLSGGVDSAVCAALWHARWAREWSASS